MNGRMERYTVESVEARKDMQTGREKTIEKLWQNSAHGAEWRDITAAYDAGVAAERERCAKSLDLKASDLRLMAGEMNAGELRTVTAVLDWLKVRMRDADGCARMPQ